LFPHEATIFFTLFEDFFSPEMEKLLTNLWKCTEIKRCYTTVRDHRLNSLLLGCISAQLHWCNTSFVRQSRNSFLHWRPRCRCYRRAPGRH